MKIKSTLLPALLVCTVLALLFRVFARPVSARPIAGGNSYDAIDTYLEQEMRRLNIPGASLVIVEGDQIVHTRGFGLARPGGETPTAQTPFVIGSLTKSFTAVAVMQLVEAGKVELDAPVQAYLPWFRVADPQASAEITVRQLLNQNSGLPQLPGMINLANLDANPGAVEDQMRALSTLELPRPVGSEFEYSNLNYNLLGLIVESASGEHYADYVQHHIFSTLALNHSFTSQAAAQKNGLALGHRYWFGFPFAIPNLPLAAGSLPSGQLISCSEDMGRYLVAHLNGGRYGDAHILSSAGMDELHRPAVKAGAMGISMGHYAMGWFVEEYDRTKILSHTGTTPDYFGFMALLPDQNRGVALLINANHVMMDKLEFSEMGIALARQVAGESLSAPKFPVVPWIMRGLLLVPVIQIFDVFQTRRRVRRWRNDPQSRPAGIRKWGLHILLPLIPNILLALALIPVLGNMRRFMMLFVPDVALLSLVSGGFAFIWIFLRTWLIQKGLRR